MSAEHIQGRLEYGEDCDSECSKENEALREALKDLVNVCEAHDKAIADVMGKPHGWKDEYLNKARAALARAV